MDMSFFDLQALQFNQVQLKSLLPYLWLLMGLVLATISSACRWKSALGRVTATLALLPPIVFQLWEIRMPAQSFFSSTFVVDSFSRTLSAAVCGLALLSALFSQNRSRSRAEWLPLLMVSVMGMSFLVGARDWVSFFVFLETVAISGYILTASDREQSFSIEASLKYLLLGAFSSALFLMGVTLLYGLVGSFDFDQVASGIYRLESTELGVAIAGMLLISTGLAFKMGLIPFHMWAPDVYQAAPTFLSAFLGSATKLSVFSAIAVSFQACGFFSYVWVTEYFFILGAGSVLVGSFMAITQSKVKRLLAYSGIVNAGYASLCLSLGFERSSDVFVFLLLYSLAFICCFAVLDSWQVDSKDLSLSKLEERSQSASPVKKVVFCFAVFSLIGIPPLPGFLGKYLVLQKLWGSPASVFFLLLGSLMGLAYYFRLISPLFFSESSKSEPSTTKDYRLAPVIVSFFCVLLLLSALLGFSRLSQWVNYMEAFAR